MKHLIGYFDYEKELGEDYILDRDRWSYYPEHLDFSRRCGRNYDKSLSSMFDPAHVGVNQSLMAQEYINLKNPPETWFNELLKKSSYLATRVSCILNSAHIYNKLYCNLRFCSHPVINLAQYPESESVLEWLDNNRPVCLFKVKFNNSYLREGVLIYFIEALYKYTESKDAFSFARYSEV